MQIHCIMYHFRHWFATWSWILCRTIQPCARGTIYSSPWVEGGIHNPRIDPVQHFNTQDLGSTVWSNFAKTANSFLRKHQSRTAPKQLQASFKQLPMSFLNVLRPCQDRFQTVSWLRRDFYGDLSLSPFVFRPCSMLHAKRFWSFPNRHTIEQSDQSWFLQGRNMSRTIRGVCFWHPIVLFFSSVQSSFAPCLTGPLGSIPVYQKVPKGTKRHLFEAGTQQRFRHASATLLRCQLRSSWSASCTTCSRCVNRQHIARVKHLYGIA